MILAPDGRLSGCRQVDSPNHDERPEGAQASLIVLHSISLPPGQYGGDAIERLFTNRLEPAAHPYFAEIASLEVSAHFLVRRDGALVQFVAVHRRAWHAGLSRWRARERCNDFSIGIELEGTEREPFAPAQYAPLGALIAALRQSLALRQLAAHSDVAPGRKSDPGRGFDWPRLLARLANH